MRSDIEIAQSAALRPIAEIAGELGLREDQWEPYGRYKAKINNITGNPGRLILVTAVTPTPAGEGKTTVSVGLADGLRRLGKRTVLCLREPSLGPVFGMKGGAAGGGYAQVAPMEDINLHFNGDLHAVTAANNLLSAAVDNHLYRGNALGLTKVVWKRCMDMNDRALRKIEVGSAKRGSLREDGFNITAASEVMAILCLASDPEDCKTRLGRIVVGFNSDGKAVTCSDLNVHGAMAALLLTALRPNLAQTLEGTPTLIHGGPFANIAHGCNSLIATRAALSLSDVAVTEAGFGADLGAEKFIDIKCRLGGLKPSVCVVVATVRAAKREGGVDNLLAHIENITDRFGLPAVAAINRYAADTDEEVASLQTVLRVNGTPCAVYEGHSKGGVGAESLAQAVIPFLVTEPESPSFAYPLEASLTDKVTLVAQKIYGADGVDFSPEAAAYARTLESLGYGDLPVCVAKTQYSLSDDKDKPGRPTGFRVRVDEFRLSAGAGFVVAIAGGIMTMPGLPKVPAYEAIDITPDGKITGLF
ncbi:MAG: formate--tetrahydrofolate ligase [Oscillospiraceae bacterium]|jgi:formate--tetrahydrofolate ligase|nr:formate--tetrahydrofolate ligase [Oscillospiraceae bacterium]